MLFKLSFENMKKSIKDYGIYFLTLVLGVAIFYLFNSLDSQEAMLKVSSSQRQMIQLMIEMLSMVSVFVAVILGLLIVYANNFLINRRKKEFGIYMTLRNGQKANFKNYFNGNHFCWVNFSWNWFGNWSFWFSIYVDFGFKIVWSRYDQISVCFFQSGLYQNLCVFCNDVCGSNVF